MDTNKSDQDRVLELLEKQRYPKPGQVVNHAALLHAAIEALVYLVQSTPPMNTSPLADEVYRALLAKRDRATV